MYINLNYYLVTILSLSANLFQLPIRSEHCFKNELSEFVGIAQCESTCLTLVPSLYHHHKKKKKKQN